MAYRTHPAVTRAELLYLGIMHDDVVKAPSNRYCWTTVPPAATSSAALSRIRSLVARTACRDDGVEVYRILRRLAFFRADLVGGTNTTSRPVTVTGGSPSI